MRGPHGSFRALPPDRPLVDIESIRQLVADHGAWIYALVFVWTFFEGETFVIFMGMAAHAGLLVWGWVFVLAWAGSFAGDQCYFWIGRRYGPTLLARFPRWHPGVEAALGLLRRYDTWFILSFRFIYGVRNLASFAMGTSGLNPLRFAILNFIAAGVWALAFAGFGYVFGRALERIIDDVIVAFGITMLTMFSLVILGAWFAKRRQRRLLRRPPPGAANEPPAL